MTPLERAARAILRAELEEHAAQLVADGILDAHTAAAAVASAVDKKWQTKIIGARSAILSIREPSDAQVLVYARKYYADNWGDGSPLAAREYTTAEDAWRDMVDALLAEGAPDATEEGKG